MSLIQTIAIIGSGKAGKYFLQELRAAGLSTEGFARNPEDGFRDLNQYSKDGKQYDLTLICVSDDAIKSVSAELPTTMGIVAHVSGVCEMSEIDEKHLNTAVFYPLMSLTPNSSPPISSIPFCIEAGQELTEASLLKLCERIGASGNLLDGDKRAYIHLAAVLSQNFSNYLIGKAFEVLNGQGINPKILLPLLEQSLKRLHHEDPFNVQTGPAVRKDLKTMKEHLKLINNQELEKMYELLSKNIIQDHDQEL